MEVHFDSRTDPANFFLHSGNRGRRSRRESREEQGPWSHVGKLIGGSKGHRRSGLAPGAVFGGFFKPKNLIFRFPINALGGGADGSSGPDHASPITSHDSLV